MLLTKIRKKILELQLNGCATRKVLADRSGISVAHIHTANTAVYHDIVEALEVLDKYYPIFERRVKRDNELIKEHLLRINRKINQTLRNEK